MKDLGERIKEYRTSMKMTQADFACRLGGDRSLCVGLRERDAAALL